MSAQVLPLGLLRPGAGGGGFGVFSEEPLMHPKPPLNGGAKRPGVCPAGGKTRTRPEPLNSPRAFCF